jgi:hypothetical protein
VPRALVDQFAPTGDALELACATNDDIRVVGDVPSRRARCATGGGTTS